MAKIPTRLALLWLTTLPIAAQSRSLAPKSRVPVKVVGDYPGGIAFPTACDEQERLYVKLIKGGPGMVGPLFRLSNKGAVEAKFDTSGAVLNRHAARPDGGVIMMYQDGSSQLVGNFAPDGKRESAIQLERPPSPFFPSQLAVFRSGEILTAGLQYNPDYKASTAIYDPRGHLVKQLTLDGDAEIERVIETGNAKDSLNAQQHREAVDKSVAITGDDGLVYLMRATTPATVYVISAGGDVVRKIVVNSRTGTGMPYFGIRVVKNRLVVQFGCDSTVNFDFCKETTYAVVDATTGERLAVYRADQEVSGPMACYAPDPDRFFTFHQQSGTIFEIVQAEPQ